MPTLTLPDPRRRPPVATVTCLAFKRHVSGSLRGFADLHIPRWRLKLLGCTVHDDQGRRWVGAPTKVRLNAQRQIETNAEGRVIFTPVVLWDDAQARVAFSEAAVTAVLAYAPDAFATGDAS